MRCVAPQQYFGCVSQVCTGSLPESRNTRRLSLLQLTVQINTVAVGVGFGQSCMLLAAGTKGKRFMLPHATGRPITVQTAVHAPADRYPSGEARKGMLLLLP